MNLLNEELGIQVEVVIGPAHSPSKKHHSYCKSNVSAWRSIYSWTIPLKSDSRTIPLEVMSVKS